jgi:class 3 adenylate cyclase
MDAQAFESPYPLRRLFLRFVLPGLVLLLVLSAAMTGVGAGILAEGLYLEQATRRAQIVDRAMTEVAPDHWRRLKHGEAPASVYADADGRTLLAELTREVRELDLAHLKIYSAQGIIQYSTDARLIGTEDRSQAFVAAAERGVSSAVHKTAPDGSALYELYVLIAVPGGSPVIFELYEPVSHLNALLWRAGTAAAGIPSILLIVLMFGMTRLVVLAQQNIDDRSALVTQLRARLEQLVSGAASQAVHRAVSAGGSIASSRTRCTILYSDVRDFTSFAEANEPERVVHFLNRVMTIVIGAIDRAGGDVDKMIGDAVMARFHGTQAETRAIGAAREALRLLEQTDLPRGVGIGIYTGDVISGTVGSADRMDFTVIGDSVNLAARLCAAAARGEIVADADTVMAAGAAEFGAAEAVSVKGRRTRLNVRRWRGVSDRRTSGPVRA